MTLPPIRPIRRLSALLLLAAAGLAPLPVRAAAPPAAPQADPVYDEYASGPLALKAIEPAAVAKDRRILVNFGTNDCAPCATFAAALHESRAFEDALKEQFFIVWIDVSPGSENEKLLKANGIDAAKGLPAIVLIDIAAKTSEFFREGEAAAAAKKGPEAVRAFLLKLFRSTEAK